MKTKIAPTYPILIILLATSLACSLTGSTTPTESTQIGIPVETDAPELPTTELPVVVEETEVPKTINHGQIVYAYQGNVWQYVVDSGANNQITMDGIDGDYEQSYKAPLVSPDGSLLAFFKQNQPYIYNFLDSTTRSLNPDDHFLQWTGEQHDYLFFRGNLECPTVDNLDAQTLLNFDLVKTSYDSPATQLVLANVTGGLRFPQQASDNLQWAGIVSCGCYSECGALGLYNLISGSFVTPPMNFFAGDLAFSPDSLFLITATRQMYGYAQSPLYIANIDYSGLTSIFSEPNSAPLLYLWSPNGDWIAMTLIYFASDGMDVTNSRVLLLRPDGSDITIVESTNADLIDWSPDGTQLLYSVTGTTATRLFIYDLVSGVKTELPITLNATISSQSDWGTMP